MQPRAEATSRADGNSTAESRQQQPEIIQGWEPKATPGAEGGAQDRVNSTMRTGGNNRKQFKADSSQCGLSDQGTKAARGGPAPAALRRAHTVIKQ